MGSVILYISIFSISAFMLTKSKMRKDKRIDMFFLLSIFLPILLGALRENVGTDYENYVLIYQDNAKLSFIQWFKSNRAFDATRFSVWLMARIAGVFNSKELFFAFFASLSVIPIAWRLKKDYDKSICALSYFMYLTMLYTTGLNTCKQIAAIGVLFFGLKYVNERKLLKYSVVVLIAASIHISSLIAIFVYFVYDYRTGFLTIKKSSIIICGIIMLALLPKIAQLLGGRFEAYFLGYDGEISNLSFFITLFWIFVFCGLFKRYTRLDNHNSTLIIMMIIGALLSLTGFYSPFIKRIAQYFTYPQFLLMGQLPNIFLKREDKFLVKLFLYGYTILLFIIQSFILGHGGIIPYQFSGGV